MLEEIKIIYDPLNDSARNGLFFEELISSAFRTQRYEVKERVNFTGMEIDLIANHKDRELEQIYIECKARKKLESKDIKSFVFNTQFREAAHGYFLSTIEYEHQVAGLIDEMRNKEKYNNLYFWGPKKIIELLEESQFLGKYDINVAPLIITKKIVLYTYQGFFKVYILRENTIPDRYIIIDLNNKQQLDEGSDFFKTIVEEIDELQDLRHIRINFSKEIDVDSGIVETIAEVKESEYWYDYLPASSRHFVGREDLRKSIFDFFERTRSNQSEFRVFYIDGKSGWGKSSLIASIRGVSRNKYYKNRNYVYAIDARSATTNNFIAMAFTKMIEEAKKANFIKGFNENDYIDITSNFDILGSETVKQLSEYLHNHKKIMILIFDQFEDVFRRPGLFKVFYKFLMDISEMRSNFLVGFSWKKEINIPIDHEAYHLWQMAKDYAFTISMREFNSKEINAVIKQLQKSVKIQLDFDLRRKIIESSQGFPWLTKKLCIHVYNQLIEGKTIESLLEEDLNIKLLFDSDLEGLSGSEVRALRFLAKRSFDGNIFDITESDDVIDEEIIRALFNKRLLLQSGTKYNIYWDIFRDYLVNDDIPILGESYILRQSVNVCLEVFLLFRQKRSLTLVELARLHPNRPTDKSIDNSVRELINIGLLRREGNYITLSNESLNVSEKSFKEYLKVKFQKYTPYLKLKQKAIDKIRLLDIVDMLERTFKGYDFSKKTWTTYARYLVGWLNFSELDVSFDLISESIGFKNWDNKETFTPQRSLESNIDIFMGIIREDIVLDYKKHSKNLYDLSAIGLINYNNTKVKLTSLGHEIAKQISQEDLFITLICKQAIKTRKIEEGVEYITRNSTKNKIEIKNHILEHLGNISSESYKKQVASRIYSWSDYIARKLKPSTHE